MANQFLGLSLFVMLLSFFIVLNSLSSFEFSKSGPVLNSLSLAFSQTEIDPDLQANLEKNMERSFREGDSLARLDALFRAQIAGVDIQKNRLGTQMRVRVDLERFEGNVLTPGADADGAFLPMFLSLLRSKDGVPYRMDMILNVEGNPASLQNEAPQPLQDKAKRVALLAQTLEGMGLEQKMISAGMGQGPVGTIDLYFHRYIAFDPAPAQSARKAEGGA